MVADDLDLMRRTGLFLADTAAQGRHLNACIFREDVPQPFNGRSFQQGFVSLHIDVHVSGKGGGDLAHPVGAGPAIRGSHTHLAAKGLNGMGDTHVVRGHHNFIQPTGTGHCLPDVLNQRLAADVQQRLSRQTGGGVTGRNDGDGIHTRASAVSLAKRSNSLSCFNRGGRLRRVSMLGPSQGALSGSG